MGRHFTPKTFILVTQGPDIRTKSILVVQRATVGLYLYSISADAMKLFRPIDEKWYHYRPIDDCGVIIRLHLSLFGSC